MTVANELEATAGQSTESLGIKRQESVPG